MTRGGVHLRLHSYKKALLPPLHRHLSFRWRNLRLSGLYATLLILLSGNLAISSHAQESPYFVTYDHYLEEPGSLETEYFSNFATQREGNDFHAYWMEFEYGATAWWTTELYLDGQTTFGDSTIFTGIRWENRLRPLKREHFLNPILYFEYEHKS